MNTNLFGAFQIPPIWNEYENFKKLANFIGGSYTGSANWNFTLFDMLYRTSWLAEKCCSVVPQDMTDKWRTFKHDDPKAVEIRLKFEEENEIADKIRQAEMQARLYGGAAVFPIISNMFDKLDQPLLMKDIKKGSLIGFHVLTKYDFAPAGGINRDITQPPRFFGDYTHYKLIRIQNAYQAANSYGVMDYTPDNSADQLTPDIHVSRIIKFIGKELPYYQKFFVGGWGDSVLTPLLDKIPAIDEAFALIYLYFDEFNIDEYKIQGLANIVNSTSGNDLFLKYKKMREKMRDTKVRFVDAGDQLNRNQLGNISGLPAVFESLANYIVAATCIPITRLLGTSTKGFGTGENELVQYYDLISQQQNRIKQQLRIIDEIIERHLFGRKMNFDYEFVSKRELTEEQRADIRSKNAATYSSYIASRVMTPKLVAENIKQEFMGIDDEYIAKLEDDFISYQEDMAALSDDGEESVDEQKQAGPEKEEKALNNSTEKDEVDASKDRDSDVDDMGAASSGPFDGPVSPSEDAVRIEDCISDTPLTESAEGRGAADETFSNS